MIGDGEVVIRVKVRRNYEAWSNSGGEILQITEDRDDINAITKEKGRTYAYFD